MPVTRFFGKLYKNLGEVAPRPTGIEVIRAVLPTIPLHLALANDFLTTDGALTGVQAADSLITSLNIATEDRVGWWLMHCSITFATGNSQLIRLGKGIPVLGSLLTVGSFIHYQKSFVLQGDTATHQWQEPMPFFCPLNTRWEIRITAAMIAGDSVRADLNLVKFYVE